MAAWQPSGQRGPVRSRPPSATPPLVPEDACPFWEPGGAALGARCAFEKLDLAGDADLAAWLLEIRGRLEDASSVEEERAMRGVFHHLLNQSSE